MKIYRLVPAFLGLLLLAAHCQPSTDQEVEAMRLLKTDWSFAKMSLEKGAAEAFRTFLAADAKLLPASGDPIEGVETIYDIMKPGYENILFRWEPKEAQVSVSGDLGYTWGVYTMTLPQGSGSPRTQTGKYVNIWRKTQSGEWRVIIDIGNQHDPDDDI